MSTLAQPALSRVTHVNVEGRSLSFAGILRSEWIKLWSLRSTWWSLGLVVVIEIGFASLRAMTIVPTTARVPSESVTEIAVVISTSGVMFGQLVIAVLGVLVISGEYSTGQIRSSFMAVPSRLPVLAAKAAVFAVAVFVVTIAGNVLSYFATMPILVSAGIDADPGDPNLWIRLVGAAGYLVFVGLISLGIGAALRSTAGGIAASLGLLLVAPMIQLISAEWASTAASWLPGAVGENLYSSGGTFEPWQALLVMLGWVGVGLTSAAILMKRRDA